MLPSEPEILSELERLCGADFLSPQERALLRLIVRRTLDGELQRLYQKALAPDLGMPSEKQVGVVKSGLRTKLEEHYRSRPAGASPVQIELLRHGYEPRFISRPSGLALDDRAQRRVADAKAAIDQRTVPGATKALQYLDEALVLEPRHPLVLALKAYCHATRALYVAPARADLETAYAIVVQTWSATTRPWESWFAEACVRMALFWDWRAAEAAFEEAIALSGGEARFQPWYTAFLACQGRSGEAVSLLRAAVNRTPDSPIVRADLASMQIYAGQFDDAEDTIGMALELFGSRAHYLLYVHHAILHEARGNGRAALDAIKRAPLSWKETAVTLGLRALFTGLAGDRATASRHFARLRTARKVAGHRVPAGQLAIAALGAGDTPAAIRYLRQGAIEERDPNLVLTNVYPFFRHLYGDPGFRSLVVDTMNLPLSS